MGIVALAFLVIFISIAYLDIEIIKLRSKIRDLEKKLNERVQLGVGMDVMYQVCKYCKHAKPTGTDLLYCEIWKQEVYEHERCDGDSENYFE